MIWKLDFISFRRFCCWIFSRRKGWMEMMALMFTLIPTFYQPLVGFRLSWIEVLNELLQWLLILREMEWMKLLCLFRTISLIHSQVCSNILRTYSFAFSSFQLDLHTNSKSSIDPHKYVASSVVAFDLQGRDIKWMTQLSITTGIISIHCWLWLELQTLAL